MKPYDLLGIGFGPSNLALSACLEEEKTAISSLFLEKQASFHWHAGMLLPEADMQISFLKDLATLRNPSSAFTFLNYLKERDRLHHFINLKTFYPSRHEFNDYLTWAAAKLAHRVQYDSDVTEVKLSAANKQLLEVSYRHQGQPQTASTHRLVIACGGKPFLPFAACDHRVWHSSTYQSNIQAFKSRKQEPLTICVLGGGQSAAEILLNLHTHFPQANIMNIQRGFGFKPADDSEFANEIFFPQQVDNMFSLDKHSKQQFLTNFKNTNYGVADAALITQLYRLRYEDQVNGTNRLQILTRTNITSVKPDEKQLLISLTHHDKPIKADLLILATGFERNGLPAALQPLSHHFILDEKGHPILSRQYKMLTKNPNFPSIYLQGFSEKSHGLADTLLSVTAIRVHEIIKDIATCQHAPWPLSANGDYDA